MVPGRETKPPHGRKPDGALGEVGFFFFARDPAGADPAIRPESEAGRAGPSRSGEGPDGHLGFVHGRCRTSRRLSDGA